MRHWTYRVGLGLLMTWAAAVCPADVSTGRTLFDNTCMRCHRSGPAGFDTPVEAMPDVLGSGTIRAHRFQLSDSQLQALVEYLTQAAGRSQ